MQLLAQQGEVIVSLGVQEARSMVCALQLYAIALSQREVRLPVSMNAGIPPPDNGQRDASTIRHRDGPVGQRVRCDRHEKE